MKLALGSSTRLRQISRQRQGLLSSIYPPHPSQMPQQPCLHVLGQPHDLNCAYSIGFGRFEKQASKSICWGWAVSGLRWSQLKKKGLRWSELKKKGLRWSEQKNRRIGGEKTEREVRQKKTEREVRQKKQKGRLDARSPSSAATTLFARSSASVVRPASFARAWVGLLAHWQAQAPSRLRTPRRLMAGCWNLFPSSCWL